MRENWGKKSRVYVSLTRKQAGNLQNKQPKETTRYNLHIMQARLKLIFFLFEVEVCMLALKLEDCGLWCQAEMKDQAEVRGFLSKLR